MVTYKVDKGKKQESYLKLQKSNNNLKVLRKMDIVSLPLGFLIGLIYILSKALTGNYIFPLGLIILAVVVIVLMLKLVLHMFYIKFSTVGYIERMNETITLAGKGIIYSYHNIQSDYATSIVSIDVKFDEIHYAKHNYTTGEIIVVGQCVRSIFVHDKLVGQEKESQLKLLNYFECDLIDIFRKSNVRVEE